jgi:hypothetical protein
VAQVKVTHRRNPAVLQRVIGARQGGVAQDMYRRGLAVQARARQLVGVDSGHLRSRIMVQPVPARGGGWAARVYVDRVAYAKVHHDGHKEIVPVRAKVLAFKPKGSRQVIFRPRVGPVRGTKFLQRALAAGRR